MSEVGDNISPDEKNQLFALLLEYADNFSLTSADLGHTTVLKHKIDTGSAVPVHLQLRRIPEAQKEKVRQLLQDMLKKEIIVPCLNLAHINNFVIT